MQQPINSDSSKRSIVISVLSLQPGFSAVDWQCEYGDILKSEQECATLLQACHAAAALQASDEGVCVDVVLPAELATLQSVSLPSKNLRQAMQALPFIVEEQLAADIEKVHIAVGARQSSGLWSVVVIDMALMSALLACCEQAKLRLRAVYVDAQLLPVASAGLTVAMQGNRVLLRTEKEMAAFERENAAEMIHFFLGDATPAEVKIYYSAEDEGQDLLAQQLATEFSALGETRVEMDSKIQVLNGVLLDAVDVSAINLLQGKFFVRQPDGKASWWKWLAVIAVCFWLAQCALQLASGWYFNHAANAMEEKMDAQFRKVFPDMRRVGGVRKQIESQLLAGASNGEGGSFAMLFSSSIQVLNAMPDHDGFEIIELRYDDQQGQVELEVKAKSIDQLDKYKQALGKSGLTAKISSANDGGSGVEGRMQINKAQ
jgi:general secretion pathway protein L